LGIAIGQQKHPRLRVHILQNMLSETKVHVLGSRKRDVYGLTLRAGNQDLRLRDSAQGSIAPFISSAGELQHDLVRIVVLGRDDRENDTPGLFYVGLNDVLYQLNIGSRLLLIFGVDESRQVHNGQVRPIRTESSTRRTNFNGNRVHRLLLIVNDTLEILSGTELFPDDRSLQTMICGTET